MSGQYFNSITENASRLGMRIQESISEHTRELAITRGASTAYLEAPDDMSKNIRKQLDSNSDREKLDAMKRLIAMVSKGRNVSEYFAQVVKNVASHNLEIRKLVYIYLLRYAEQEPDLALLSINTFQKDLTDINPLIRAMALRVLSGIKVPMIGSIVVLAIKKCAADVSPYVRKNAALAIPKCFELDPSHTPALITIVTALLRDRSSLCIGSVAVAFEAVCPTRLDLLHQQYRRLCRILVDVDEWGQVDLMSLLLRYARMMLARPDMEGDSIDPDLDLLLNSTEPLLQSRNPAVVLGATRIFYYAGPPSRLSKVTQPLLRLLPGSKEVSRIVLVYISVIARDSPSLFTPYYARFLVSTDDLRVVKLTKIQMLLHLLTPETYSSILREFIDCADDTDNEVVAAAIQALGKCSHQIPESTQTCLNALISMIKSRHDTVVSNAVLVLKILVQNELEAESHNRPIQTQQNPGMSIISHLAHRIDDIKHPQARACVVWLAGQYASSDAPSAGCAGMHDWAPDVLRKAVKGFIDEDPIVKLQVITMAAKLLVLNPTNRTLLLLGRHTLNLAKYDLDYDVRDRARMVGALLVGVLPKEANGADEVLEERGGVVLRREQVRVVLFNGKAGVVDKDKPSDDRSLLGSLGMITGRPMRGDVILTDWLEEGIEPSLRTNPDDTPTPSAIPTAISSRPHSKAPSAHASPVILTPGASPSGSAMRDSSKGVWRDLDSFYAEESEEEEEDDGSEDDEENEDDNGEEDGEAEADEETDEDDSDEDSLDATTNETRSMLQPSAGASS
ncbi:hypothetical protein PLEOSDRAFT_1078678 [Pleurotus ostreatus PC15]|uniref:Clathrin/coatomer adaptor adaptin-like N-terminal domain-containing protein n=1 Tax=Pleurotus ostreatus (strain PC15) TaxID=1137138 RepID=A0A067N986_PLEO1|nr:hypothetical protein PLEOSDRAFT_1078678 [Pleurotus ostreatus PC15]